MARLPENIDRLTDGNGYRYVAYSKDGFSIRLNHVRYDGSGSKTGRWHGYATLTGRYVGSGRTLADIAKIAADFVVMARD